MAVVLTNLANNVSTSNGFSTGSLSWTAGSRGIVAVSTAIASGSGDTVGHTVTGGGVTWTEVTGGVGGQVYKSRRILSVFQSDGTPTTGALTITSLTDGTYQESQWSVEEVTGQHATPFDGAQFSAVDGPTAINTADLGTIDAGDLAYFAVGFEAATDSLAVAAGSTQHILRQSGGNVRSLLIGKSTTDDTPGATWGTGSNGAGISGFIINAAAGGGGSAVTGTGAATAPVVTSSGAGAIGRVGSGSLSVVIATVAGSGTVETPFTTVTVNGVLIDENGDPVEATGITVEMWEDVTSPVGAPDQTLTAQVSDAGGNFSWQFTIGGLTGTEDVFVRYIIPASPPTQFGAGVFTPTYG
jgi:hypothetical protein